jgi:hypothetical protein
VKPCSMLFGVSLFFFNSKDSDFLQAV